MRIRAALITGVLLMPLLLTACGEGQGAEPTPTPTPALKPIQWEFPLWSEILREIEDCIPDERITISDIRQDDSSLHVGGYTSAVICAYEYAKNLDESSYFSLIDTRCREGHDEALGYTFEIDVSLEKDYTLYVDGANIWHYPVFPPESSYQYFPGSEAHGLVIDTGIETEYMYGKTYQPYADIEGINYTAIGFEFEMWTEEDTAQIIEFLELLEENGQQRMPIIGINNSNNQSLSQSAGNETEASSLWKIDDINVRHRCCCWILTLDMVFVYTGSERGFWAGSDGGYSEFFYYW